MEKLNTNDKFMRYLTKNIDGGVAYANKIVLRGSFIFWVRVNLGIYYNLGLLHFPIIKKKY